MSLNVVKNATCTFCGCVCGDIELHAESDRIVKAKNACSLWESWFRNHTAERLYPDALIDGKLATLDAAIEAAAHFLYQANMPLVYGAQQHHVRGPAGARRMVLVDIRETLSAKAADIFLQIRPGKDFEVATALRALVKNQPVDKERAEETGLTVERLQDFADRMKRAKFGVIFFGWAFR